MRDTPPSLVIVEIEICPGGGLARLELPGTTTVSQAIQQGVNLPERLLRRRVRELLASSNGNTPSQVDAGRRLDDLAIQDPEGQDRTVKVTLNGRTSRFGSHWAMACDLATQLELLGWRRMRDEVVLRDNEGTYVTTRDRLDNGLADLNRYQQRRKLSV